MRAQIRLAVVGIVVWSGIVTPAWAACNSELRETTGNFIGGVQVCSQNNVVEEIRKGRWVIDDGGMLNGTMDVKRDIFGGYTLMKDGQLITPTFIGHLTINEQAWLDSTRTQVVGGTEDLEGLETLPAGGTFDGSIRMTILNKGKGVQKTGRLLTNDFNGTLFYFEIKSKNSLGEFVTFTEERREGIWTLLPRRKYQGTLRVVTENGVVTKEEDTRRLTF